MNYTGGGASGNSSLKGASHADMSDGRREMAFTLVRGVAHADICDDKRKSAFTLAEVLITLGIIGIVAAMTLPAIIGHYQKEVTVNRLKVAYALLTDSIRAAEGFHSEFIADWDTTLDEAAFGEKYLKPFVKTLRVCKKMEDGCWETDGFYGYYDLRGNRITTSVPYSVVLANGMIVGINKVEGLNLLSYIVDLDGKGGRNTMGRDIFSFYLFSKENNENTFVYEALKNIDLRNGLYPGGYYDFGVPHILLEREKLTGSSLLRLCSKNASGGGGKRPGVGSACAALIAKDGWKIKDDSPW